MPAHTIELKLDHDTLVVNPVVEEVGWLAGIHWTINDPGIESFRLVSKPTSTHNIFTSHAERGYNTTLNLTVSIFVFRDWDYSIYWKDKATHTEHISDPKIAVKSKAFANLSIIIIMPLILVLITFKTVGYFRKMKTK